MEMIFQNRAEAGQLLRAKVQEYQSLENLVVLGIPRGGVVVGKELASFLNCPLDVVVIKKIGAPNNPELAIGAVGPFGSTQGKPIIDGGLAAKFGADSDYLQSKIEELKLEVAVREKVLREGKPPLVLKDKNVLLVDDGVATGSTMQAAVDIVRQQEPKKLVVVVPVIAKDSLLKIERLADGVVYLEAPDVFFSVGQFYRDFSQITDEEVKDCLYR